MRGKSYLFFSVAALSVIAVFIFSVASANAYAVPSTGQPLGGQSQEQPSTSSGFDTNYNFGGSFQNLVSPFQNFFNSLQWNASNSIQISPTSTLVPAINITPSLQNIFTQFDNWFYGLTGFRLSEIVVVILTGLSWALTLARGIVDWLLGLFH